MPAMTHPKPLSN